MARTHWRLTTVVALFTALSLLAACSGALDEQKIFAGDDLVAREYVAVKTGPYDLKLSYLRAGDASKQRVIFVHGTPGQSEGWLRYLRATPADLEFIAVDRPGFGATEPLELVAELQHQAAAIAPLLVSRDGKKPILVGHSLGGPIVAELAATYADQIGGVVMLAGSVDPAQEEIKAIQYIGRYPPALWLLPKYLKNTNEEVFALKPELELLGKKLDKITSPMIIIHGTADDLVPYENVPYMLAKITQARPLELLTLEGQNHFLPWNSEGHVRAAIDRIVAGFPGGIRAHTTISVGKEETETGEFEPPARMVN